MFVYQDYQSEKYVQRALDRASKGRTTIIVSHRLSAIRHADRVLFIEKGQIVEEGTHTNLLEAKGRYYEMVKMQDNKKNVKKADRLKHKQKANANITHKQRQYIKQKSIDDAKKEKDESESESESDSDSDESSIDESDDESDSTKDEIQYLHNFMRILGLAKPDWPRLIIAITAAFIVGSAFPLFSIVFAEVYGVCIQIEQK